MLPITGPFNRSVGGPSSVYREEASWLRQKPPFDRPLPYTSKKGWFDRRDDASDVWEWLVGPGQLSREENEARSKAWSKFMGTISEKSELATNLFEARQSVDMIAKRATQLASAFKALRRGEVSKVLRILTEGSGRPVRRSSSDRHFRSKNISSQWLELHFGWVPMIQDIYNAINVLQGEFGLIRARGSAASSGTILNASSDPFSRSSTQHVVIFVQYGADVRITNPNLALANNLGLVNPLLWAHEAVPFSFVADWFSNVSQFLGAWSEFLGYSVENPFSTVTYHTAFNYAWSNYPWQGNGQCHYIERTLGLNRPELFVRPFRGFSVVRAATAMSLLIGFLPKK